MWSPIVRERVRLVSSFGAARCVERLRATTGPALPLAAPARAPVRGVVGARRFLIGRADAARVPLRTWAAGTLREREPGGPTDVDVRLGPNPWLGGPALVGSAMLAAVACVATRLLWDGVPGAARAAAASWAALIGSAALFFVVPAVGHARERAFLLAHLRRTLRALPAR
jgi:hypothetical protein